MNEDGQSPFARVAEGPRGFVREEEAAPPPGVVAGTDPGISRLRERFGESILRHEIQAGDQRVVFVDAGRNVEILRWLKEESEERFDLLVDVTAVDHGGGGPLETVYQLWSIPHRKALRVKCELPLSHLRIESVCSLWKTANWLEREVYDLFGIHFENHPDLRRILMPERYAEGHPLRKDFPLRGRFSRAEQTRRALSQDPRDHYMPLELALGGSPEPAEGMSTETIEWRAGRNPETRTFGEPAHGSATPLELSEPDLDSESMLINIGPQHPATHGVLRLVCELDGETVMRVIPHIGYLHSSFEKLGEYRDWNQIIPLTDRMDYLAPLIYNCVYAMAVEKLMGIEVTERCKVARVICMEMDRIFSHLLWLGTTAIDVGAFTPFLYAFHQREKIYKLHEALTGARITTSATRIGGMMADLPAGWTEGVREFIDNFPPVLDEIETLLTTNAIHVGRTRDVGVISAEEAINHGFTGPNLRASGVPYDLRGDRPYYDYESYDFEIPVGEHGDCYDRYLVRMEEMRQSCRILHQALDRLPGGPINVSDHQVILPGKRECMSDMESMIHHFKLVMEGVKAPPGDCYFAVEGSKGELGMYVVSDGAKPVRWRIRPPSFVNLSVIPTLAEGHMVSDLIMINASLDIVLGEIDR